MASPESETQMSAAVAREHFAEVVNRVAYGRERIVLSRRGKAVVAMVSMDDLQLLEALEERADMAAAREAEAEAVRAGTIPWETVRKDCGV